MSERLLFFNGIRCDTGQYGRVPMDVAEFAELITRQDVSRFADGEGDELRWRLFQQQSHSYAISPSLDPSRLSESGWGIIFPSETDPAVLEALRPLLDLRAAQSGSELFKIFIHKNGYRPGETKSNFLARNGVGPGSVEPLQVPYYLLLVGSPQEIPFTFQRQLDLQYAVGRISFSTPEEYANYAANVVAAEQGLIRPSRRAVFFGVANPYDHPSQSAIDLLIKPLHQHMMESLKARQADWRVSAILRDATKSRLERLLNSGDPPALLVTSSHGVEFPRLDPRQMTQQGALLCGDWPGPAAWGRRPIPESLYFSAPDLSPDADLSGLIALFFGSFSAGTPVFDELDSATGSGNDIAPYPFLASLPARLLGRPRGALAVVGFAGRAWGYSQSWQGIGGTTAVFQSALERLAAGNPVGMAMEYFDERYAEMATDLTQVLDDLQWGLKADPIMIASKWVAVQDSRNLVIIGDPAVRVVGGR